MDQSPVELLEMIFDRLSIDQIDQCRMVCKKWQFIIDCLMNFDCLVIYKNFLPVNQTFFPTNQRVSLRYLINSDQLFTDRSKFKKVIFSKFKRIYLYSGLKAVRFTNLSAFYSAILPGLPSCKMAFDMTMLNYLSQLEELHFGWFKIEGSCRLSLPNLKTFKICQPIGGEITLDTPRLTDISFMIYIGINLLHPETIETLEVKAGNFARHMFRESYMSEFLMSLNGLKCLLIETSRPEIDSEMMRTRGVIEFLRVRVKEIHFLGITDYSRALCQVMKELKEQSKQIKIYFNGLDCLRNLLDEPIDSENLLNRRPLVTKNQLKLYLTSAISEPLPLYTVNYNLIEELIITSFYKREPNLFSARKLPRLEVVIVKEQVKDELTFSRWLSGSNTLLEIQFDYPLSQEFYTSLLPATCPNLQCLRFNFNAPLDFLFLLKLKFLYSVEFTRDNNSSYNLVELLFPNLTHLKYLGFYENRGKTIKVSLGVVKRENEKKITYELYDGQVLDNLNIWKRYVPVKRFDTFESLAKFTNEFTGF